jgi:hypothetical protein
MRLLRFVFYCGRLRVHLELHDRHSESFKPTLRAICLAYTYRIVFAPSISVQNTKPGVLHLMGSGFRSCCHLTLLYVHVH